MYMERNGWMDGWMRMNGDAKGDFDEDGYRL